MSSSISSSQSPSKSPSINSVLSSQSNTGNFCAKSSFKFLLFRIPNYNIFGVNLVRNLGGRESGRRNFRFQLKKFPTFQTKILTTFFSRKVKSFLQKY